MLTIGFMISIICLLYIWLKLKLNNVIKTILMIMAFHNCMSLLFMLVSNGLMIGSVVTVVRFHGISALL